MDLLAFDDAHDGVRVTGRHDAGLRAIPLERIVGSLDRSTAFDRSFRPRRRESRQRLASLRAASRERELPPIDVYEFRGVFFVVDGHHRVALARETDAHFIDAQVVHVQTEEAGPLLPPHRPRSALMRLVRRAATLVAPPAAAPGLS
jgi:hypothetical protein